MYESKWQSVKESLKDKALLKEQVLINGNWVHAKSGNTIEVLSPFNQELVGTVPELSPEEVSHAISAAQFAGQQWRKTTPLERAKILKNWASLIAQHRTELAQLLSLEQGKPLTEALGEIDYSLSYIDWFAEEAKRIAGDVLSPVSRELRQHTLKVPIGVCAAIIAWNFPSTLAARKISPALAAGCTVVLKPSELAPFTVLTMADLAQKAGVPAGVINVITGKPEEVGEVLTKSEIVRKITFTGSTETGRLLMKGSSETIKNLSLELGGNAPFIVFEDAEIDKAVDALVFSKFRNAGQTCVCPNRVYVHSSIKEPFLEKLIAKVKEIKVGDGFDDAITMGPLINSNSVNKVISLIDDAVKKGADLLVGGKLLKENTFLFEPTVLSNISKEMLISQHEVFGPVIAISVFDSDDEVLMLANDTEYGLAAYFFTENRKRIRSFLEELEFGVIGVNTGAVSNVVSPFGGLKSSGLGREGSKYGIDEYLEIKSICEGI